MLVADGLGDAAIAGRLALAVSTVGTYVRRVRAKLGLGRRAEIAAWVAAHRRALLVTRAAQGAGGRSARR